VTTSGDMTSTPASALVRPLRAREIGSRELLDAYLDRIEQVNPAINAVVTIDAEAARAAAADEQIARGQELGALHGLPMTVKDALETAGMRTTSGFPDLAQYVPARDADAVARLRGQGA
jgi:amidase